MYQNLLLNQARLDSLPVSDEQVDSEMENRLRYIISSMPGGKDQFEKFYGKSITQIKEDFRVIIRNQILARDMQQKTRLPFLHNLKRWDLPVLPF